MSITLRCSCGYANVWLAVLGHQLGRIAKDDGTKYFKKYFSAGEDLASSADALWNQIVDLEPELAKIDFLRNCHDQYRTDLVIDLMRTAVVMRHGKEDHGVATPLTYTKTGDDSYRAQPLRTYHRSQLEPRLAPELARQETVEELLKELASKSSISYAPFR